MYMYQRWKEEEEQKNKKKKPRTAILKDWKFSRLYNSYSKWSYTMATKLNLNYNKIDKSDQFLRYL